LQEQHKKAASVAEKEHAERLLKKIELKEQEKSADLSKKEAEVKKAQELEEQAKKKAEQIKEEQKKKEEAAKKAEE